MKNISTVVIIIISSYVAFLQIFKIIYTLFKPKFLNPERFGPPKTKLMLVAYYLVALFFVVMMIIEKIEYLSN
ncbi:MAG: hypothetical protein WKF35_01610 [Ferruginibacter sp.]